MCIAEFNHCSIRAKRHLASIKLSEASNIPLVVPKAVAFFFYPIIFGLTSVFAIFSALTIVVKRFIEREKDKNFVKSHGREPSEFIRKQGELIA